MRICKHCNKEFDLEPKIFANHVRWCDDRPTKDKTKDVENRKVATTKSFNKKYGELKEYTVECNKCSKSIIVEEREKQFPKKENYYCSRSCANSRNWQDPKYKESNEIRRYKAKELWLDDDFAKRVIENNSMKNVRFTSKNEDIIKTHFIVNYPEDGWTFGGLLKIEDERISRDLYSKKLKICFEYDGIWHFKDIKGQLKKKQKKDRLLKEWCIKNNYRLIRVDEEWFNDDLVKIKDIEDMIYNSNDKLILKGNRY